MDQTSSYHGSFDFDYLHLPANAMHDPLDISKAQNHGVDSPHHRPNRLFSYDTHDNLSFLFSHKDDDASHIDSIANQALLKTWQAPQIHNPFLDMALDSNFGMDAFQIRSRGGSFNFGRFRKDSEDLFNLSSDVFRNLRTFNNDTRNSLENALLKKPVQSHVEQNHFSPKHHMEAPPLFADNQYHNHHYQFPNHHGSMINMHINQNSIMNNNDMHFHHNGGYAGQAKMSQDTEGTGIFASVRNTDSTVDSADSENGVNNKRGRKKRMLNDRSEAPGAGNREEDNNKNANNAGKPGRPKKNKEELIAKIEEEASSPQKSGKKQQDNKNKNGKRVKLEDSTYSNIKSEGQGHERDDKSTEISSTMSKIEDSPYTSKGMNSSYNHSVYGRTSANNSDDMKNMLGMFSNMTDILKGAQGFPQSNGGWMDARRIGTLTVAERRVKIEKYLQKRKKRTWSRKINYDCRKRVADSRLRIKGRFVTRDQAFTLMDQAGITYDPVNITNPEIKALLTEKFGGRALKKKKLQAALEAAGVISGGNNMNTMSYGDNITGMKRQSEVELDEMDLEDE